MQKSGRKRSSTAKWVNCGSVYMSCGNENERSRATLVFLVVLFFSDSCQSILVYISCRCTAVFVNTMLSKNKETCRNPHTVCILEPILSWRAKIELYSLLCMDIFLCDMCRVHTSCTDYFPGISVTCTDDVSAKETMPGNPELVTMPHGLPNI